MVTNFEEITKELTKEEKQCIKYLIVGFEKRTKQNPILAKDVVKGINIVYVGLGIKSKFTSVKLRKMTNFIRANGILPLIATSKGYFTSTDKEDIQNQINSLHERASSINKSASGMYKYL